MKKNTYQRSDGSVGHFQPWIDDKQLLRAVGCARTLIRHGRPAALAIHRASVKYGVSMSKIAAEVSKVAHIVKALKRGEEP